MVISQDDCGLSNFTQTAAEYMFFASYKILLPVYLIIGLSGNITLLVAFWKRSKTEKAYAYQMILTMSKTLEILSFGMYLFCSFWLSSYFGEGVSWYVRNKFLVYCNAKLGPIFAMLFVESSLLCSVAMAADRVFALWKPFVYKNIKHSQHQKISAILCFLIPACTVMQDWSYLNVVSEGDIYKIEPNEVFIGSLVATVFSYVRAVIRVVGVVSLVTLCILMILLFRQKMTKVGQLSTAAERKSARKEADRTLFILNVYQSVLMCFNQIPHTTWLLIIYMFPKMSRCGAIIGPLCDGFIFVTDSIDIFIILTINKKMRQLVSGIVPSIKLCKDSQSTGANVVAIGVAPAAT